MPTIWDSLIILAFVSLVSRKTVVLAFPLGFIEGAGPNNYSDFRQSCKNHWRMRVKYTRS